MKPLRLQLLGFWQVSAHRGGLCQKLLQISKRLKKMFQTESLGLLVKLYLVITPLFVGFLKKPSNELYETLCTNEAASANDPGANHSRLGTVPVELSSFALVLAVLDICEVHDKYKYMYRKWHIEFPPVESGGAGNEPILSQKFIQHLGHPWVTSD